MSLHLGELSIGLELENDRLRPAIAGVKKELESVPPAARREMVKVSRVLDEEGNRAGGVLAQGINSGLVRNSPLIVAGVSAALAAGAPLMTVAAGTLFAGVGAVAAAQTLEVRSAWTNLGHDIRDGAIEDAAVLVPVYVEMADRIGGAFRKMRPELQQAFADSAPLIRSFTDGILALADNAMPGLTRAVAGAGPVFDGLEHFLSETGQGLTEFFDALTAHSPAAGSAFASLGDIMGDLLPILGELLGQGAELAAGVLPLVSGALGITLDVLQMLGPALPIVASGFLALKVAQTASGWVTNLGEALGNTAAKGGMFSGVAGRMSSGIAASSAALGPLSLALGLATAGFAAAEQESNRLAQALMEGGQAAAAAEEEISALGRGYDTGSGFFDSFLVGLNSSNLGLTLNKQAARDATDEFGRMLSGLSPVEAAQRNVRIAQEAVNQAINEFGPGSNQAEGASRVLASAQRDLTREQNNLEMATHGVTSAMIEQAEQALAGIDSGFAYRKSVDDLEDAQARLAETIANRTSADKELRTTEEDVARASLAVEEQNYKTALSWAQQQADLSGLSKDSAEYARIIQEQTLAKLYELQSAAGPEMAAAIGQQIAALEASGVSLTATATSASSTADRMRDLGLSVVQVPGSKTVFIDAPTAEQKARLEALGYTVRTLPDGRIYVTADTTSAEGTVAEFMNRRRTIGIQLQIQSGNAGRLGNLGGLGGTQLASGGIVHAYKEGGFESMPGGIAQVVKPNTWRIIGDRVRDDEAYIPINDDSRSLSILQQTANRMGYDLQAFAGGGFSAGAAASATAAPRTGPLIEMNGVSIGDQGDAVRLAQELAYAARTRGW